MPVTVTSTEFQRNVGTYTDRALKEPLMITNHGRERLVLISVEDYTRLRMLDNREVLLAEDLPEALIHDLNSRIEKDAAEGVIPTTFELMKF